MKTKKIYSILAGSLLLSATSVSAQEMLNSGYFVEGYNYRHQLNLNQPIRVTSASHSWAT